MQTVQQNFRKSISLDFVCRFYVPSNTWQLKVSLSNCRPFQRLALRDACIKWVGLRARALPMFAEVRRVKCLEHYTYMHTH